MNMTGLLQNRALLHILLVLSFSFSACEKNGGPTETDNNTNGAVSFRSTSLGPLPVPADVVNLKGVLATVKGAWQGQTAIGAIGLFMDASNQRFVSGGTLKVNGTTIRSRSLSGQVIYQYPQSSSDPPLQGVRFDGSTHTWTVSGAGEVPAFTGSVTSASGSVSIRSPADNAIINRAQGITVNWTATGDNPTCVAIMDDQAHIVGGMATGTAHGFSVAQLSTLAAGEALVLVESFRYSVAHAGGKDFLILSIVADVHTVTLQ